MPPKNNFCMKFIIFSHVFFSILLIIFLEKILRHLLIRVFLEGYSALLITTITVKIFTNLFTGFIIIYFLLVNAYGLFCCLASLKYDYRVFLYPFIFTAFVMIILPTIIYLVKYGID
jgi:hypothetical protein